MADFMVDKGGRKTGKIGSDTDSTALPADIDRYQYGYDQDSNRLYKANVVGTPIVTGGLDEYYTYDHLNRLTEMQRGTLDGTYTGITGTPTAEQNWVLDPTGNWHRFWINASGSPALLQFRYSNPVNEITRITASAGTPLWVTPSYDAAGNTTTMPQVADPTLSFIAIYDAWNRMVTIGDGTNTIGQYSYDGRNFRIVKLTYASGVLSETRHFYYTKDWQDIEQRVDSSTDMDQQHVWGVRYIDELVCRDDATPDRLYAAQDANFNVTSLVNTLASVPQRFVYDPFGENTVLTGSWNFGSDSYKWVDRFQGRQFALETEMIYYRRRIYNPAIGAFLQRDPIRYWDGLNMYLFAAGRPTVALDPYGLQVGRADDTNPLRPG